MKNLNMDDFLKRQGVRELPDRELMEHLTALENEMEKMVECLKALLVSMRTDLDNATAELMRRDQAVALWQQRWNLELDKRIEAEKKLQARRDYDRG